MERLGDDELSFILERIHDSDDYKSFFQVSKKFMKIACIRLLKLHISLPDFLYDILPRSPNLVSFVCSKPLSNAHMKLLAQSCPKLRHLMLSSEQNVDPSEDLVPGELDFDDDGLCAVANSCNHLYEVLLSRRLHVGDVGVTALVRSSRSLAFLDLSRCVNVTDESLKTIGKASSLRVLSLQGCCLVTDLGLEHLANGDVRNCLEELILSECERISDDGIICMTQMHCLTDLNLSKGGVNVTNFGIVALSQIPNIERLDLSWLINVTDMPLLVIARECSNLKAIYLTGCEAITSEGVRAFANHQTIEELQLLSCHNFSWEDVELVLFSCRNLTYLGLNRRLKIPIPEKEVSHLQNVINGGTENHDDDAWTVSFPGSPGSFKWEGIHGSFSPVTAVKRMSQKKKYEVALVGAFRREKDEDITLQALTAESRAAMQLVLGYHGPLANRQPGRAFLDAVA